MSDDATRVVHVGDGVPGAVYIGRGMPRQRRSPFGNPYAITPEQPRAVAIARYRERLARSPDLLAALPALRGKPLACWCRHDGETNLGHNACHGDVLIEFLDRYTDAELEAMS